MLLILLSLKYVYYISFKETILHGYTTGSAQPAVNWVPSYTACAGGLQLSSSFPDTKGASFTDTQLMQSHRTPMKKDPEHDLILCYPCLETLNTFSFACDFVKWNLREYGSMHVSKGAICMLEVPRCPTHIQHS